MQEQMEYLNNENVSLKAIIEKFEHESAGGIREEYNRVISLKNQEIDHYREMLQSVE